VSKFVWPRNFTLYFFFFFLYVFKLFNSDLEEEI
jgi:hypothetical protein